MQTPARKEKRRRERESERVINGCTYNQWCNMDSDGQMERGGTDRWCMGGEKVMTEEESMEGERESCQLSVQRAQG